MIQYISLVLGALIFLIFIAVPLILKLFYKKVTQSKAIVRNGLGGAKVSFTGMWVIPILHNWEIMNISVKRVEIAREGKDGLICKDNIRADIRVAFFVKVNDTEHDVLSVAKSLGTVKASDTETLMEFFDAKFSEALKTAGKQFDFVQLYTERNRFKEEILQVIGEDLNGYKLEDAAIDYLEQTNISFLNPDNVLDSEGIKKITEKTAQEKIKSNQIERDKQKTIKEQDVSAKQAILELEKQEAEATVKQKREIENIKSREEQIIKTVSEEERLKGEQARIRTDEEIAILEENKERSIIVAQKSKEATEAVETQRVEKQRDLEKTEKEKVITLAQIEKDKKVEEEKKNIAEVVKERVMVEKTVVQEEERIKDTKEFAAADRKKRVEITDAEAKAEVNIVDKIKEAEAIKKSAEIIAEKDIIVAETQLKTSYKTAEATKVNADAKAEEKAVDGVAESRILKAKADALEIEGKAKANVTKMQADANAESISKESRAKAEGIEVQGIAEAKVVKEKAFSEAEGINEKAKAMKEFDSVGKEHEEFKLRLNKEKEIELAEIAIQKDIAFAQAQLVSEGLKQAKIDIVGGDSIFFDKLVKSITVAKQANSLIDKSPVIKNISDTLFTGERETFKRELKSFMDMFGIDPAAIRDLSISAALLKTIENTSEENQSIVKQMLKKVENLGLSNLPINKILD
ncbi:MAG: hypothetical protein JW924_07305 [Fusobacteriaceae bacterium]|nr:hypothetical protein [Fusobacteriaceae bacterium]